MTHDITRDDGSFPDESSEIPAAPSDPRDADTAIPIPKPAPSSASVSGTDAAHDEHPSAETIQATGQTPSEEGATSWFSKLRINRNDAPEETSSASPASDSISPRGNAPRTGTPEPDRKPDTAVNAGSPETVSPTGDISTSVSASTSTSASTRRIVVVKRHQHRSATHDLARLLGMPDDALSTRAYQTILIGGTALVLLALLANSPGLALTVLSALVPLLLLATLAGSGSARELTSERGIVLAMTGLCGVLVGGLFGWVAARTAASSWFDEGVLNFGAAGFGGRYAHAAGNAGWLVWLVNGLVLPVGAIAAALALPVVLYRSGRFPALTSNGLLLGAAAATGYAIGTAAVFWSPLNIHGAPDFATSDWTLMIVGIAVLQPVIAVLAFASVAVAVWQYLDDRQVTPAVVPASCGLGCMLLLRMGSIWIQPRQDRLWLEFSWTLLVAVAMVALYRLTVTRTTSARA